MYLEKWAKVLHYDMISSKESSKESEGVEECIILKALIKSKQVYGIIG